MNSYEYVVNKESPELGGNMWQGDPWTFAPRVWQFVAERFAISSVLDVGSGRGYSSKWFHEKGYKVVAMDGEIINVYDSLYPTVLHNIAKQPFICPVDLVHCQEVVEHIPEEHLPNVLRTLTNGRIVLMTHATPGQPGHNHVNCQEPEYWIKAMDNYGFNLLTDDTDHVRSIAVHDRAHHLARSGLVFGKRIAAE